MPSLRPIVPCLWGGLDEREGVANLHPDATRGAAVVVDFEDGVTEGSVAAWRLVAQGIFLLSGGLLGCNSGEFVAVLGELAGD